MIQIHYVVISMGMALAIGFAAYFIHYRRRFALWAKIVALFGAAVVIASLTLSLVEMRFAAYMSLAERIRFAYFRSYMMGLASGVFFAFLVVFFCNRALFKKAVEKGAAAGESVS